MVQSFFWRYNKKLLRKGIQRFWIAEVLEFLSAQSVDSVVFFILNVNWWIIADVFRIVVRLKRRQLRTRQQNITSGKTLILTT